MQALSVQGLTKTYKSGLQALKTTDLSIGKGEIFALLGSSGCGKTSTLRMIAGHEAASEGAVVLGGRDITDLPAAARAMREMEGIEWAEPVYERRGNALPGPATDPMYADQWHLDGANIPAAWAYLEGQAKAPGGSPDITVA